MEDGPAQRLLEVLEAAKRQGFLGPGPIDEHVEHARALGELVPVDARTVIDLGSGAGIPGLVLAVDRPEVELVLVEGSSRRAAHLVRSVQQLGATSVVVDGRRAELVGRDPARRGAADAVVARSFGPPAVLAEMAAPLLRVGGVLLVSEPPVDGPDRWPVDPLTVLGLAPEGIVRERPRFARLRQTAACPDAYPRRTGVPERRPLYEL